MYLKLLVALAPSFPIPKYKNPTTKAIIKCMVILVIVKLLSLQRIKNVLIRRIPSCLWKGEAYISLRHKFPGSKFGRCGFFGVAVVFPSQIVNVDTSLICDNLGTSALNCVISFGDWTGVIKPDCICFS